MRKPLIRSILLLVVLVLLPASLAAREPDEPVGPRDPAQDVRYEVQFMDMHAAEVLAWDQCPSKERCRVAAVSSPGQRRTGFLEVRAEPAVQEKIARVLLREDTHPRQHGFQIVLLAAVAKSAGGAQALPANVQKALTNLQGFAPAKSYEVLDMTWMRGTAERGLEARLLDHQGAAYQAVLHFHDTGLPADHTLFADSFHLKAESFTPQGLGSRDTRPSATLLDTSFGLKEGETLVVGTAKVGGSNDALVVLIMAVPAP